MGVCFFALVLSLTDTCGVGGLIPIGNLRQEAV
jgi:hypothetical protein